MAKYTLTKEFRFEAAHKLPKHDGKCQRLHGHSWVLRVFLQGDGLHAAGPKSGMLFDYTNISAIVRPYLEEYLDHHYLNETLGIEDPTSENIARWAFNLFFDKLPGLKAVEVDETCTSRCRYEL